MIDYSQYAMQDGEDLYSYLARLEQTRKGGILGTGGLMDMPPEAAEKSLTSQPLGEVIQNCPVGYVWNGRSCVPAGRGGDGDSEDIQVSPATLQQMIDAKTGRTIDPVDILRLGGPIGGLMGAGVGYLRDNALEKALEERGYTKDQIDIAMSNPEYVAQQIYSGRVGDDPIDGTYRPKDAGKWGIGDVVGNFFGDLFKSKASPAIDGYGAAPELRIDQSSPYSGMGQGLLTGQGSSRNRQYYITSDDTVRDVTGRPKETLAGLEAVAGGAFRTPSWYSDDTDDSPSFGSTSKTYRDTTGLSKTGSWDFNKD